MSAFDVVRDVLNTPPEGEGAVVLSEDEALDALAALHSIEAENERLRQALHEIVTQADTVDAEQPWTWIGPCMNEIARAALARIPESKES
ncbi:MAG: hypothetical protein H0U46_10925 [Actinobacteria bacterium]|nr:hypothetical protein [Actinomycetota bacterium]